MIFSLSKIIWLLLSPLNLVLFGFLFGYIFKVMKVKFLKFFFYYFSFIIFIISTLLPTGSYLNYLLEKNYHSSNFYPNSVDGILILGGATNPFLTNEYGMVSLNASAERLYESINLIRRYSDSKVVFSGGSGSLKFPDLNHSNSVKILFENMGIDVNKIFFENQSRNTYENILFTKKLINPKINEKWLVVSSASHLNRTIYIGEKLEWILIPYAVDFNNSKTFIWSFHFNFIKNLIEFHSSTHEWLGLISYYFMGRSSRII